MALSAVGALANAQSAPIVSSAPGFVSPMHVFSRSVLARRLHTLGVPSEALLQCQTVADVQRLARPYYRALARRYHPDHQVQHGPNGKPLTGFSFRRVTKTYRWLMSLQPDLLVRTIPPPSSREYIIEHDPEDIGWGWHIQWH